MSEPDAIRDDEPTGSESSDDDLRALLARRRHSRPNRTTWVLLALLLVAFGFVLGSCTQRAMSTFSERMAPPPANESTAAPDQPSGS
jgi:hypothetical protein